MMDRMRAFALAMVGIASFANPAPAQPAVADFYKGKTIAIVMGTGPGGSYDLYGRIIAEHLSRHIPGNPNIIIEHMPGAGGVTAGNFIYATGPQDGTKILLSHALPMSEMLDPRGVRFQSANFQWLGTYDVITHTMTLWHQAPVKTIADLKNASVVIGSVARAHLTYQFTAMMKDVLGLNYKIITGYLSGTDNYLAMERGEIHGWAASWESLVGTRAQWLAENKVTLLAQFTLERKKDLAKVPTLLELAPNDKKDVVEFLTAGTPFARGMAVGPGVPAERAAALRKAFMDTMRDPAFLAATQKRKVDIDARDWQHTHMLVKKIVGASPDLVARVKKSIGQD